MTLGFDLGVDATFDLSKGDDRYAFFGAIVVDPGFGEIAVGAPRSIGSVLIDRPVFAWVIALFIVVMGGAGASPQRSRSRSCAT